MNKPKILIPIHPQWCEKIFNGEKTVEVRKTAPKIDTPFEALVYETKGATDTPWVDEDGHFIYKGRGQVIGSFVCDGISHIHTLGFDDKMSKQTCLTFGELSRYYCLYLRVRACNDCDDCIDTWCGVGNIKPLARAPQSWCYVGEV